MDYLQRRIDAETEKLLHACKTKDEFDCLAQAIIEGQAALVESFHKEHLLSLNDFSREQGLRVISDRQNTFLKDNLDKWQEGFDALDIMVNFCVEVGGGTWERLRNEAAESKDLLFNVLARLQAKACLVSQEILCLLKNGFADGAHARWRALHEISITALFLHKREGDIVERYLAHEIVDSYKGAIGLKEYEERLQVSALPDESMRDLKEQYDAVIKRYGSEFSNPYGWAENALGIKRANFSHIEKDVGMDHWRPYYKWASQNVHSGSKTISKSLGNSSPQEFVLVGPSDLGMVDPADLLAISLSQVTAAFLTLAPNIDSAVAIKVIESLRNEIGPIFLKCRKKYEG